MSLLCEVAFALKPFMLRPYPRRNQLNIHELKLKYRLSRARKFIENTFGILASKLCIITRPIIGKIENIKHITKAAVILHNFLMKERKMVLIAYPTMRIKKQCNERYLDVGWLKLFGVRFLLDWEDKGQIISLELQKNYATVLKISLTHHKEK